MAWPAASPSCPARLLGGLLVLLLPLLLLAPPAAANVRLAFPPARALGDFLYASQLQPGPCGGPRPTGGAVTHLQAAALVNVSWHNSHPIPGELTTPPELAEGLRHAPQGGGNCDAARASQIAGGSEFTIGRGWAEPQGAPLDNPVIKGRDCWQSSSASYTPQSGPSGTDPSSSCRTAPRRYS